MKPDSQIPSSVHASDSSEKKMIRGSFAISLLVHSLILLLIGSIVIVPGVVKEMNRITTVAPPPVDIPPPPPMEVQPDVTQDDPGGSPISDAQPAQAPTPSTDTDALTLANPVNTGPSLSAALPGASSVSVDAFTSGKGGSGGGTGIGVGKGTGTRTFFGSHEKLDGTLVGRLYDFKQDRIRQKTSFNVGDILKSFVGAEFSTSILSRFYLSPTPLYAHSIFFPRINASEGPKAFNVEKEVAPVNFMVHYTGMIAPSKDVTVRFCGYGDDWLIVGINGRVVLDGSWATGANHVFFGWKPPETGKQLFPGAIFTYGSWIDWSAGDYKKIDIAWSETGGGTSALGVYIQVKGETYQMGPDGIPEYPLFRLSSEQVKLPDNPGPYHPFAPNGIIFQTRKNP